MPTTATKTKRVAAVIADIHSVNLLQGVALNLNAIDMRRLPTGARPAIKQARISVAEAIAELR